MSNFTEWIVAIIMSTIRLTHVPKSQLATSYVWSGPITGLTMANDLSTDTVRQNRVHLPCDKGFTIYIVRLLCILRVFHSTELFRNRDMYRIVILTRISNRSARLIPPWTSFLTSSRMRTRLESYYVVST